MTSFASTLVGLGLDMMAGAFPKTIRIETTNGCNAKCIICPHSEMGRPVRTMPDDLFRRIVEECARHRLDTVHLHNFGEPLLDRKLPERIALCKSQGIRRVKIFSNGSLLTEERGRALIAAGLDEIKISFDGATREDFERIRPPLRYESVVENVLTLVRLRDDTPGCRLRIHVTCTSTTDRDRTMERLAGRVDGFSFGKIHNWADWDSDKVDAGRARSGRRKPCARVWQTFTILSDGRVALCCLDYNGSEILGDLADPAQTIAAIWRGEAYRRVRACHRSGRQAEIPVCAQCAKSFW